MKSLRPVCLVLGSLMLVAGAAGMSVGLLFLASKDLIDVVAAVGALIAGAVLAAAGLVSLTLLATQPARAEPKAGGYPEIA